MGEVGPKCNMINSDGINRRDRVKSAAKSRGLADFGVEFLGTLYARQQELADFFRAPDTIEV